MLLQDKTILITGAARRIGAEITRHLHADGATVIIHYAHSEAEAQELATELNEKRADSALSLCMHLRQTEDLHKIIKGLIAKTGRLDALVNNASTFFPTPLGQINETSWDNLVESNFKGPLFLSQACAPYLEQTQGSIINITDIHAERPLKGYPLYSACKGALLSLTRALAVELAPHVRVNAVAPGPIIWPEDKQYSNAERTAIIEHTLLQRQGEASDIARTVHFLLAQASYITGQVLNVDGGRSAHL